MPVLAIAAPVFENSKRYNGKRNMGNLVIFSDKCKSMVENVKLAFPRESGTRYRGFCAYKGNRAVSPTGRRIPIGTRLAVCINAVSINHTDTYD